MKFLQDKKEMNFNDNVLTAAFVVKFINNARDFRLSQFYHICALL